MTPPQTPQFKCTVGGSELPPKRHEAPQSSINPAPSNLMIPAVRPRESGPFDLNERGVLTPPFEDFLEFAKIPPTNPAAQQIRDLGFETWRAFEVGPCMLVDCLKSEGLKVGTAMGLIGKAKVYRQH